MLAALGLAFAFANSTRASAAPAPVGLGTAAGYAVLAGTTVTNTGPSVISGDVGLSPGSAVVGFPPGNLNGGTIHAADPSAAQAQLDVTTGYNDAAGRATTATITADLGGQTLVAGVYSGGTLGLTGTLTLDAQGDPNAVFIFQTASTLITASSSVIALTNGADACNVYWQVDSSATLGTNSVFVGTVLALTSIAATTSASINGRLLARNGEVTLDSNTITSAACGASTSPTTTTTTTTTTQTPTTAAATPTTTTGVPTTGPTTPSPPEGGLPKTGTSSWLLVVLASGAVALGGVLMVVRRRHPA